MIVTNVQFVKINMRLAHIICLFAVKGKIPQKIHSITLTLQVVTKTKRNKIKKILIIHNVNNKN